MTRAGRDPATWLRELRALRTHATHYRSTAVTDDALWSVVEDPRIDPAARAGAAAALADSPDAAARIRVAAESTASPRLRVALARIAEAPGDEFVEGALEEVEESAARR